LGCWRLLGDLCDSKAEHMEVLVPKVAVDDYFACNGDLWKEPEPE
jgi:hypothetical protein